MDLDHWKIRPARPHASGRCGATTETRKRRAERGKAGMGGRLPCRIRHAVAIVEGMTESSGPLSVANRTPNRPRFRAIRLKYLMPNDLTFEYTELLRKTHCVMRRQVAEANCSSRRQLLQIRSDSTAVVLAVAKSRDRVRSARLPSVPRIE